MAQRNNPINRVPGNPLAGIIRTLNQQGRYAQRRRGAVPTITSQPVPTGNGATASSASVASAATTAAPLVAPLAAPAARVAVEPEAAATMQVSSATRDATQVGTVTTDASGKALFELDGFRDQPVVTVTAESFGPILPVIESVDREAVAVVAYDVPSGERAAGVTLHVSATGPAVS